MSASDPKGIFVELGEYNLILARATLGSKPRTIEAIKEVWIGDAAGTDSALSEIRSGGTPAKAVALLRVKSHSIFLPAADQAKTVTDAAAVEKFLKSACSAENLPANWAWADSSSGLAPQGGARWVLDAAPTANTEESLGKIRGWSFELVRCQSAPLTLAGALTSAVKAATLLVEVGENTSTLVALSGAGISSVANIAVGLDALAGSTQTTLGLKFRGSAARLMFNESYDFTESASGIVEPLANAIKAALPSLGATPAQITCGGILGRQTWITQALGKALGLAPVSFDAAAWASSHSLAFGSGIAAADIAPSWLGVLNAAATCDFSSPATSRAWNTLLSNTPLAAGTPPVVQEAAKPAVIPAIAPEPAKPAAPSKPAVIPAIIQEQPKPAQPQAKPAVVPAIIQEPPKPVAPKPSTPAVQPKPAVIITPPAKPVEPAKPATPPAKPAAPGKQDGKPAATPPAKPAPAPAKPAPKPETAKPSPIAKPSPAPVTSGVKPATAAPFPSKRTNLPIIIAIAAVLAIGGIVGFMMYSSGQSKKEAAEREAKIRLEAEARIKAQERARAEAEEKAKQEREAREKELQDAQLRLKTQEEASRKQQEEERNRYLYGRGNLVVATEPAGASITVGEFGTKSSPLTMKDLRLGPYTVTISMPGYDTETRTVEIKDKETTDLGTIILKRQYGSIELSSEPTGLAYEVKPAGSLFVNPSDVRKGQTPDTLSNLPVGSYVVTITRPTWPAYTSTVNLERDGTVRVNGDFPGGSVVINSNPQGGTVLRDNQVQIGTTPLTLNGVPPGAVSFTVTMRGCDPVTLNGKLEGGKTLTLTATMLDSDRIMRISELDERPVPIAQADPELTPAQLAEGGKANVSLLVGKDGVPSDLRVDNASSPAFGRACLSAAAKWRFKPGVVRGKPVRCRVSIPFKITGEGQ